MTRERKVVRPEDRHIVIAVAVQMWCARMQAWESKRPNGDSKYGYSPDLDLCVGEAAALLQRVDEHIAPQQRTEALKERRRRGAVELQWNVVGGS